MCQFHYQHAGNEVDTCAIVVSKPIGCAFKNRCICKVTANYNDVLCAPVTYSSTLLEFKCFNIDFVLAGYQCFPTARTMH